MAVDFFRVLRYNIAKEGRVLYERDMGGCFDGLQ
jgi:hypothetical protein